MGVIKENIKKLLKCRNMQEYLEDCKAGIKEKYSMVDFFFIYSRTNFPGICNFSGQLCRSYLINGMKKRKKNASTINNQY